MPGHLTEAPQDLPQHLVPSPAVGNRLKQEFLSINHTALSWPLLVGPESTAKMILHIKVLAS